MFKLHDSQDCNLVVSYSDVQNYRSSQAPLYPPTLNNNFMNIFCRQQFKSNNLSCILTPNITQVRARGKRQQVWWPTAGSFGWAIRSSPSVKQGAHGDLMLLGHSFTINLHKLVLLSKEIISLSHTCLLLPWTTPSLDPAPSDISMCLFSAMGQNRSGFLVFNFILVRTHENKMSLPC